MARITEALLTEYVDQLRKRTHPLLGHPSINIGTIKGGSQTNVVPERCSIENRPTNLARRDRGIRLPRNQSSF